jgi:DNA polymerase-1
MFEYTAKGNVKFGRDVLHKYISDAALLDDLEMRSRLQKLLSTYVRPFAQSYAEHNGKFYFWLSQTRGTDDFGTRTGRFSSNIQQIPKEPKDDRLPFVRSFIVAKPGYVLLKRDFSQQELRVAAHYAEGGILQAYKDNPKLDVHSFVQETIKKAAGIQIDRTTIKTISFLKLYRGGARLLAEKFGISYEAAATFFKAYDEGLPEFVKLMRNVEAMAERGEPIRTWGGRYYLPEPPKDGKTYYYKMGNVLIQGSSADMTKEAMNRYYYHPDRKGRLALTVHDELVVEVLEEYMHEEMAILQWAMDDIPGWDVPLASDGFYGYNYGELKEYEQPN